MKVLVTGADGFIGQNLCASLESLHHGFDRRERYSQLVGVDVLRCTRATSRDELAKMCAQADFVFHLAGVNRSDDEADFEKGNVAFTAELIEMLEACGNACPVMFASSIQADADHPRSHSPYAESKRAAEQIVRNHRCTCRSAAYIYRLANVFGKWSRPGYNSAVATFCDVLVHGAAPHVDAARAQVSLLYIDDLVEELLDALCGRASAGDDGFFYAGPVHTLSVGELALRLEDIEERRHTLYVGNAPEHSLDAVLEATLYSFADPAVAPLTLEQHADERGLFAELVHGGAGGQVSVIKVAPGAVRGNHWHHSKRERFFVIAGQGKVRMRRHGIDADGKAFPTVERDVCGERLDVADMLPGYAHSIVNTSASDELVIIVWASQVFDEYNPDTYFEEV